MNEQRVSLSDTGLSLNPGSALSGEVTRARACALRERPPAASLADAPAIGGQRRYGLGAPGAQAVQALSALELGDVLLTAALRHFFLAWFSLFANDWLGRSICPLGREAVGAAFGAPHESWGATSEPSRVALRHARRPSAGARAISSPPTALPPMFEPVQACANPASNAAPTPNNAKPKLN